MRMVNFLQETERALANHQLTWRSVRCIRNHAGYISHADFVKEAALITYDSDFGSVCIDPTLKLIGGSWWYERRHYNGREGWVFCHKPDIPSLPAIHCHLTVEAHTPVPETFDLFES